MASSKSFVDYVVDQLGEGGSARPMMGEYVLYYRGKVVGVICDDRAFLKDLPSAAEYGDFSREPPYPGAKPMLAIDDPDDAATLRSLTQALWAELPQPKPRKKRGGTQDTAKTGPC